MLAVEKKDPNIEKSLTAAYVMQRGLYISASLSKKV